MNKVPSSVGIGSDLEMFLFDNAKAKIVPCVGILDGTKDTPYTPAGYSEGFAIQEDNVMVEYNIPPARNVAAFSTSMRMGRQMVLEELQRRYGSQYSLYKKSHTHEFTAVDLASAQAQRIGCEPDMDAYEGGATRINPPRPGMSRSCGGHVHLGGDFKCPDFVSALFAELFIAVRGGICPKDTDPRTLWYGKPGIFRPKPYGIEYRTPNNNWAMHNAGIEIVGHYGLACARWLTTTDAVNLQKAFRMIPWITVRKYVQSNKTTKASKEMYEAIIDTAYKAGVPL